MRISTKGRYGLRALVDLTVYSRKEVVSLTEIAKRQNLSLNYLEQVFGMLRKKGIVEHAKGTHRGCVLAVDPFTLTAGEVLEVLEGKTEIVSQEEWNQLDNMQKAIKVMVWDRIEDEIDRIEQVTIGEMAEEYLKKCNGQDLME